MPVGLQGRAEGGADQAARTGDRDVHHPLRGYVHAPLPAGRGLAASVGRRMSTRMLLVLALLCGMAILLSFTVLVLTA